MRRYRKPLAHDDLARYMYFKVPVRLTFYDIVEDGIIEFHDDFIVKINGNYFVKNACSFWA
ncbi:hypothetical protein PAECIP111802_04145 [Paenibacillus allorhizosphaerae]|uniref:Uncharacterized protein n=1 Tax=Paenibacillus allorhizosphaerae TaxID=2849866 RepID=A0ABM8VL65_9BACL|nr:hypothetical protein PAECIP111802_04145 [Paenibacillus allorhizosphaerae]